jgi:hypothetical protein
LAAQVYAHSEFLDLFHLPLTIFAFEELPELKDLLSSNHSSDQMDVWVYNWEDNYILANFYAKNHKHLTIPKKFHWLCKSSYMMKNKVFN